MLQSSTIMSRAAMTTERNTSWHTTPHHRTHQISKAPLSTAHISAN